MTRAGGVPVARREDQGPARVEAHGVAVEDRDHPVALGNGQRAARTEVVLDIDDHERVTGRIDGESHAHTPVA
jgi:hypothetical protein